MKNYLHLAAICCISLAGCSSSSTPDASNGVTDSGNNTADTVLTGVFVDSAVEGVSYSTETQTGITNAAGEFNYLIGESVTFSIGSTQLPTVLAGEQISPIDIAASSDDPSATTTNIARLLQSLDLDGNPDNGISIPPTASAASSSDINFELNTEPFSSDPAVINLVANSGSVTTELINADDANAHLNDTLGISSNQNTQSVDSPTPDGTELLQVNYPNSTIDIMYVINDNDFSMNPENLVAFTRYFNAKNVGVVMNVVDDSGTLTLRDGEIMVTEGTCLSVEVDFSEANYEELTEMATVRTPLEIKGENASVAEVNYEGNEEFTFSDLDLIRKPTYNSISSVDSDATCFFDIANTKLELYYFRGSLDMTLPDGTFASTSQPNVRIVYDYLSFWQ